MTSAMYPTNWYWLADDGRIYSSASQSQVPASDQGYVDWSDTYTPTPWPRDDAGNQTDASLQDVLGPYNLFANLTYYTADARWRRRNSGIIVTSLSPVAFMSDDASVNDINASYNYAQANTSATFQWKMSDGSFTTLNNAKITTLHNDTLNYVQSCFTCESNTINSINGGTITTMAEVDAAFAAISNVFP
jgi:hypothetical protein